MMSKYGFRNVRKGKWCYAKLWSMHREIMYIKENDPITRANHNDNIKLRGFTQNVRG